MNTDSSATTGYWAPGPIIIHDLQHFPGSKKKITAQRTEIAVTGRKIVFITNRGYYWVFETADLSFVCAGRFCENIYELYRDNDDKWEEQTPIPDSIPVSDFEDIAIHDDFLVIAMKQRILVFSVDTDRDPGRWMCTCEIKTALIQKLYFSTDGTEVFALVRVTKHNAQYEQILVLAQSDFAPSDLVRVKPHAVAAVLVREWELGPEEHVDFIVSASRELIAAYTSPSGQFASVRILRKNNDIWQDLGSQKIRKSSPKESNTWGAKIRGVRLYVPLFRNDINETACKMTCTLL